MSPPRSLLAIGSLILSVLFASRAVALTAYRITDLDLRDPHVFVNILLCRDVTDVDFFGFSVNGDLQTRIQTDGDMDGLLDLSSLIVFDDYNPAAPGGTLTLVDAYCTAPVAGTSCTPSGILPFIVSYTNGAAGTCLGTIVGTLWDPYTPEVTLSTAPCFVSEEFSGTLPLFAGGTPVQMEHIQIAATYGAPNLVNGLIRGFLTEQVANTTILPASLPLIGGMPFSVLLPGGDPPGAGNTNCASHSDKDFVNGVPGWWFYYNFTAQPVPYQSATGIDTPAARGVAIHAAVPNPFNPSTTIRYTIDAAARVLVSVYDANGRFVAELVNEQQSAGDHEARWNGATSMGTTASSGVYFVRLESGGKTDARKIVLLK